MRKTLLLILTIISLSSTSWGQFEYKGSYDYGIIETIIPDPQIENRLYATSHGNHIIYSNDKGNTWDLYFTVPNGVIRQLKYLAGHNSITFITEQTNDYALYILDLETKAITRKFILPPQQNSTIEWIGEYDIWQNDPNIALVIQNYRIGLAGYQKVQYTKNGGENWDEIYFSEDFNQVLINNVRISPNNSEKLFLARDRANEDETGTPGGGVLISENAGQTYIEKLPELAWHQIEFNPNNPDEIWLGSFHLNLDDRVEVFKSTDGGENWSLVDIDWEPYSFDAILKISFNPYNPNHITILETNEIAISYDSGETWEVNTYYGGENDLSTYYYGTDITYDAFNEGEVYISGNYFCYFSPDHGRTINRVLNPFFNGWGNVKIQKYDDSDNSKFLFYGVQGGLISLNLSTGQEIDYHISDLNEIGSMHYPNKFYVDQNLPGRIYTTTGNFMGRSLFITNDFGETEMILHNDFIFAHILLEPIPHQINKIWTVTIADEHGHGVKLLEIDFYDTNNIQISEINLPSTELVTNLLINDNNSDEAIITQGRKVYRTIDAGASWTDISNGLEEITEGFILDLVRNPLNHSQLTLTTFSGIYTSYNNGDNWEMLTSQPGTTVFHSDKVNGHIISPHVSSYLSGFEFLISTNGGASWTNISNESFGYIHTKETLTAIDMEFYEDSVDLYISATGLGIIKYNLDLTNLSVSDPIIISKNKATIYPNPTSDFINILINEDVESVQIYDAVGNIIKQIDGQSKINVSDLNKGIYILNIITKDGNKYSKKFLKN